MEECQFAVRDHCFRCKKPIVEMNTGNGPVTAKVHEHYVTPWGPVCAGCLPCMWDAWTSFVSIREEEV